MKIKRNVLGDIYRVAQAIQATEDKTYTTTLIQGSGSNIREVSALEYSQQLAEYIVNEIEEHADDEFFARFIEEGKHE
ncbi:hypothetical protein [Lacticaseibacillus saniviri]